MKSLFLLAACSLLAGRLSVFSAPGDLDAGFGDGGKVTVNFSGNDVARSVAVMSDGRIVVGGYVGYSGDSADFAAARLDIAGNLDPTFGGTGKVITNIGGNAVHRDFDYGNSIALASNGRLVLGGSWESAATNAPRQFAFFGYSSDGTPDSEFNFGNPVRSELASGATAIATRAGGQIVAVGSNPAAGGTSRIVVAQLRPDGGFDNSFGYQGRMLIDWNYPCHATSVSTTDGEVTVAGYAEISGAARFMLLRPGPDQFNPLLRVTTDVGEGPDYCHGLAIQSDGRFVLVGESAGTLALVRYNADGSLDSSFGGTGKVISNLASAGYAVAVQDDDYLLVAGKRFNGADDDFILLRLTPTGILDTRFNGSGYITADFGGGADSANSISIAPNGKAVLAACRT